MVCSRVLVQFCGDCSVELYNVQQCAVRSLPYLEALVEFLLAPLHLGHDLLGRLQVQCIVQDSTWADFSSASVLRRCFSSSFFFRLSLERLCSAAQGSAVQYRAVQGSAAQCSAVQYSAL